MSTEAMKLQEIMSQAQVFASAWSLVGGRFDGGNAMDEAEVAKNELHQMVAEALAQPQQEPVGSLSVRYHRGCKSMTNTDFDYNGDLPEGDYELYTSPPAQPQQEPVAKVDANDEGYWADILPDRTVKVGQLLYAEAPQAAHGIKGEA